MAQKKKAAKKSKPVKAKAAPKKATKAAKAKRASSPRSQVLPGMEQVRNRVLDRICEEISDVRDILNGARKDDKDLQNQAVSVMSESKTTVYRHAGVELALIPGDVHVRVRTLKVTANADGPAEGQDPSAIGNALTKDIELTQDDERLAAEGDEA